MTLGGTIFIHAGIPPASAPETLDALNTQLRDEVKRMDGSSSGSWRRSSRSRSSRWRKCWSVARAQIAAANEAIARAKASGDTRRCRSSTSTSSRKPRPSSRWTSGWAWTATAPCGGEDWPTTRRPDRRPAAAAAATLQGRAVRRRPHTHRHRRITVRFGGRAVLLDTGMNRRHNGNPAALEIAGDQLTAIYLDRREALTQ